MPNVWFIVERSPDSHSDELVRAMQQAISNGACEISSVSGEAKPQSAVSPASRLAPRQRPQFGGQILAVTEITKDWQLPQADVLCPLTLHLPDWLQFTGQSVFHACRNTNALRQKLAQKQFLTGDGTYWLPIVLTGKGPVYAEVIGCRATVTAPLEPDAESGFFQPVHLADADRQAIYQMGQWLLNILAAPPSVYLLQFGWQNQVPCFDRLLPFPAQPAIASMRNQTPDLFACHWHCLTGQSLHDLAIASR